MTEPSVVDLRSDTVTRPGPAMRAAMAEAPVGDDVLGEDPTINALQARAAALTGKEAALFVPSGTMANLLAILAQTRPGDTVVMSQDAHPYNYESGNVALVAGVMTRLIPGALGQFTAAGAAPFIVPVGSDHHLAPTTLIATENTSNRGGGAIYGLETLAGIRALAHQHGLKVHCDGARLFNAVVETGVTAAQYAAQADTVSFCLSKGLGAPAGSLLCGDAATIDRAHRYRKMLGGGMRQAGILAAAGLYALDHHVERLREDHARARAFRDAVAAVDGLELPLPSPTNMVYVDVPDAAAAAGQLAARGVLTLPTKPTRLRAVFHLDVDDAGLERAIAAFRSLG